MSGLLLDQTVPGATTCLVIGELPNPVGFALDCYQSILWWADPTHAHATIARLGLKRVSLGSLEAATPAVIAQTLEHFVRLNPKKLPSLYVTEAIGGPHDETYRMIIAETHALLEDTRRSRFTRQQDGFFWQKHILQNAAAYARNRVPASWAGALRGRPAFIVGAGPSLDVSIPQLAAHAGRAVIFSSDSALRALARHGVTADFAVSIDVAKIPAKCLAPDGPAPARVILASVSPPAWQAAVPSAPFFLSGHQLTDDWFAAQGVARTEVAVTESCGSTALELAHYLGCDPIHLFGMDLAVDPADQARRHQQDADAALYVRSNFDPTARLPRVPGNYTDTVPCFALGDWRELDARLATRTAPTVINVTDRGARLRGTTVVHPDAFALDAPPLDRSSLTAALEPVETPESATAALKALRIVGARCAQALPGLRHALTFRGPAA
ncbi:MAG: 6-hydroxymethylpterin diphosphokinase MptE-like protein, partial [Lacunisphaera sp.]